MGRGRDQHMIIEASIIPKQKINSEIKIWPEAKLRAPQALKFPISAEIYMLRSTKEKDSKMTWSLLSQNWLPSRDNLKVKNQNKIQDNEKDTC